MSKRIRYKNGDIFLIKLQENMYGAGMVIKKYMGTVFICVYKMEPILEEKADFKKVVEHEVLDMTWCFDEYLKNGIWKIVDNVPIDENFIMPNFATVGADGKYYLIRGSDTPEGEKCDQYPEITYEDYQKLYSYGTAFPSAVEKGYLMRLKDKGIM